VDHLGIAQPLFGPGLLTAQHGQSRPAFDGDPAHDLGVSEVSWLTPHFPDTSVRFTPALQRGFHGLYDDAPRTLTERVARARVFINTVNDPAQNVELSLVVGTVADARRSAPDVARQVIEFDFDR